jgi:hypothetical protein
VAKGKHRFRYKVEAGLFIGPDLSQEPAEVKNPDGTTAKKYPSRTWKAGEVFDSDEDLLPRVGPNKLRVISGEPEEPTPPAGHSFPGGQVSSGYQQTSGFGQSGLVPPERAQEVREASADYEAPKAAEHKGEAKAHHGKK